MRSAPTRGRHLDLAYALAGQHFADPEDLMHKATGWLLREVGKRAIACLDLHVVGNHLPAGPAGPGYSSVVLQL